MDYSGFDVETEPMTHDLARLWSRRATLTSSGNHEETSTIDVILMLDDKDADDGSTCYQPTYLQSQYEGLPDFKDKKQKFEGGDGETIAGLDGEVQLCLNGSTLGDIPARYTVPVPREYEFPAVGVWVHPHIVSGFKYLIRPLGNSEKHLFEGKALRLLTIGRGYARRLTFEPASGCLNDNQNYFWTDSWPNGFGLELQLTNPGEEYTMLNVCHLAVAHVTIMSLIGHQKEIDHEQMDDGTIYKTATFEAMVKIIWIDQGHAPIIIPINGTAIATKSKQEKAAKTLRILGLSWAGVFRRGFSLIPGIEHCREVTVDGSSINDVPTRYTLEGLEPYEFPIVGTYVDPRILPGFRYKVRVLGDKPKPRMLFNGRTLRLNSVGAGYGKRLTFEPDTNSLNSPNNYFWSDTHPDGLGLESRGVEAGETFSVLVCDRLVGEAIVFRADAPQREESQKIIRNKDCLTSIIKRIRVEVTCFITLDGQEEAQAMRITGSAVLIKNQKEQCARLICIENVGLDSQVNLIYAHEGAPITFHPIDKI